MLYAQNTHTYTHRQWLRCCATTVYRPTFFHSLLDKKLLYASVCKDFLNPQHHRITQKNEQWIINYSPFLSFCLLVVGHQCGGGHRSDG